MFDLICEIRTLVRDAKARSASGRCRFSVEQKVKIVLFAKAVEDQGLQLHDAASILGMKTSTLQHWIGKTPMDAPR